MKIFTGFSCIMENVETPKDVGLIETLDVFKLKRQAVCSAAPL